MHVQGLFSGLSAKRITFPVAMVHCEIRYIVDKAHDLEKAEGKQGLPLKQRTNRGKGALLSCCHFRALFLPIWSGIERKNEMQKIYKDE